jgi:predicted metal-binding protein
MGDPKKLPFHINHPSQGNHSQGRLQYASSMRIDQMKFQSSWNARTNKNQVSVKGVVLIVGCNRKCSVLFKKNHAREESMDEGRFDKRL